MNGAPSPTQEHPAWWSAQPRSDHGRSLFVDLAKAQTPASGDCIVGDWWTVHPEKGVAFYYKPFGYGRSEEPSPQANGSESTARLLAGRLWPDCEVRYLQVVYMAHALRAMAADKQALVSARKDGSPPQTGGVS